MLLLPLSLSEIDRSWWATVREANGKHEAEALAAWQWLRGGGGGSALGWIEDMRRVVGRVAQGGGRKGREGRGGGAGGRVVARGLRL